jgi:hypothetical protein
LETRSWRGVLYTTLCDKVRQLLATGMWFSTLLIDQVQAKLSTVTPLRKYEASIAGIVFGNWELPYVILINSK